MAVLTIGMVGQAKTFDITDLTDQRIADIMTEYRHGKTRVIKITGYLQVTRANLAYMLVLEDK